MNASGPLHFPGDLPRTNDRNLEPVGPVSTSAKPASTKRGTLSRQEPQGKGRRRLEIHDQAHSAWLQHAAHLGQAAPFQVAGQVVQDQPAHDHVERRIRERQGFHQPLLKLGGQACPRRIAPGHRDHLRGRVDAVRLARRPDPPLGGQGQAARATAHIQYLVARFHLRQRADARLTAPQNEMGQGIVKGSLMKDVAARLQSRFRCMGVLVRMRHHKIPFLAIVFRRSIARAMMGG
jgi:hypothetical protein